MLTLLTVIVQCDIYGVIIVGDGAAVARDVVARDVVGDVVDDRWLASKLLLQQR